MSIPSTSRRIKQIPGQPLNHGPGMSNLPLIQLTRLQMRLINSTEFALHINDNRTHNPSGRLARYVQYMLKSTDTIQHPRTFPSGIDDFFLVRIQIIGKTEMRYVHIVHLDQW